MMKILLFISFLLFGGTYSFSQETKSYPIKGIVIEELEPNKDTIFLNNVSIKVYSGDKLISVHFSNASGKFDFSVPYTAYQNNTVKVYFEYPNYQPVKAMDNGPYDCFGGSKSFWEIIMSKN